MKYTILLHRNSRNASRRGLTVRRNALGTPVMVTFSRQVLRDPAGTDLPHEPHPWTVRAARSKYAPHVGARQLARKGGVA